MELDFLILYHASLKLRRAETVPVFDVRGATAAAAAAVAGCAATGLVDCRLFLAGAFEDLGPLGEGARGSVRPVVSDDRGAFQ